MHKFIIFIFFFRLQYIPVLIGGFAISAYFSSENVYHLEMLGFFPILPILTRARGHSDKLYDHH